MHKVHNKKYTTKLNYDVLKEIILRRYSKKLNEDISKVSSDLKTKIDNLIDNNQNINNLVQGNGNINNEKNIKFLEKQKSDIEQIISDFKKGNIGTDIKYLNKPIKGNTPEDKIRSLERLLQKINNSLNIIRKKSESYSKKDELINNIYNNLSNLSKKLTGRQDLSDYEGAFDLFELDNKSKFGNITNLNDFNTLFNDTLEDLSKYSAKFKYLIVNNKETPNLTSIIKIYINNINRYESFDEYITDEFNRIFSEKKSSSDDITESVVSMAEAYPNQLTDFDTAWIFRADNKEQAIKFGENHTFCISATSKTNYFYNYRFKNLTAYFVYFKPKDSIVFNKTKMCVIHVFPNYDNVEYYLTGWKNPPSGEMASHDVRTKEDLIKEVRNITGGCVLTDEMINILQPVKYSGEEELLNKNIRNIRYNRNNLDLNTPIVVSEEIFKLNPIPAKNTPEEKQEGPVVSLGTLIDAYNKAEDPELKKSIHNFIDLILSEKVKDTVDKDLYTKIFKDVDKGSINAKNNSIVGKQREMLKTAKDASEAIENMISLSKIDNIVNNVKTSLQ